MTVSMLGRRNMGVGAALAVVAVLGWPGTSLGAAAPDSGAVREAGKHFQRGVTLYGEADYRGALVEFMRAEALAPSAAVLYNISETYYQLHDYAGALTTFEQYLTSASASDPHRLEVENNVKVLRTRVGKLTITTVPSGADLSIDDQAAGKTPLDKPLVVNVGHLKVVATKAGHPPLTRYVDVAAEDNLSVTLELSDSGPADRPSLQARGDEDASVPQGRSALRVAGWVVTGAAVAGAVTFGLLARREENRLKDARAHDYPASPARLDQLSRRTTTYAIVTDALVATAVVVGVFTFFYKAGSSERTSNAARLSVGPTSAVFETTF